MPVLSLKEIFYFENNEEVDYKTQRFSDDSGEYRVPDIIDWAKKNAPLKMFSVNALAKSAFEDSPEDSHDEVPGSKQYVKRAMKSDLKYPIIVIRYDDGDFVADGNHRLWKARAEGHKTIKGYLMKDTDLQNLKSVSESLSLKEVFLGEIDKETSYSYYGDLQRRDPELHAKLEKMAKFAIRASRSKNGPSDMAGNLGNMFTNNPEVNPIQSGDTIGVEMFIDYILSDNPKEAGKVKRYYNSVTNALLKKRYGA